MYLFLKNKDNTSIVYYSHCLSEFVTRPIGNGNDEVQYTH